MDRRMRQCTNIHESHFGFTIFRSDDFSGGREGGREGGRDDCYTYSNRYVQ